MAGQCLLWFPSAHGVADAAFVGGTGGSFWIGGALCGAELPWEAVGSFGWEPTASVNSFRYQWALRQFGPQHAFATVELLDAYEDLRELYDLPMLPDEWMKLGADRRQEIVARATAVLGQFRQRLKSLRQSVANDQQQSWFQHMALFAAYFEYHLQRVDALARMHALLVANKQALNDGKGLAGPLRDQLLAMYQKTRALAEAFDHEAAAVPSAMIAASRTTTRLFQESWITGYTSGSAALEIKPFAGTLAVSSQELLAGRPFSLRVEVCNSGIYPWTPDIGPCLQLRGDVQALKLPSRSRFQSALVFGDRRTIELTGKTPDQPGEVQLQVVLAAPVPDAPPFVLKKIKLRWK